MCRSRREHSNVYLLAKFGIDTAENEPSEVLLAMETQESMPEQPRRLRDLRAEAEAALQQKNSTYRNGEVSTAKPAVALRVFPTRCQIC